VKGNRISSRLIVLAMKESTWFPTSLEIWWVMKERMHVDFGVEPLGQNAYLGIS